MLSVKEGGGGIESEPFQCVNVPYSFILQIYGICRFPALDLLFHDEKEDGLVKIRKEVGRCPPVHDGVEGCGGISGV